MIADVETVLDGNRDQLRPSCSTGANNELAKVCSIAMGWLNPGLDRQSLSDVIQVNDLRALVQIRLPPSESVSVLLLHRWQIGKHIEINRLSELRSITSAISGMISLETTGVRSANGYSKDKLDSSFSYLNPGQKQQGRLQLGKILSGSWTWMDRLIS